MATVFTLIASSMLVTTYIARTFHVPVRQEAVLGGRVPLFRTFGVKVVVFLEGMKDGLRDLEVILCVGTGVEVVSQSKFLK